MSLTSHDGSTRPGLSEVEGLTMSLKLLKSSMKQVVQKSIEGVRLDEREGTLLYELDLPRLGMIADARRRTLLERESFKKHNTEIVTFVVDRQINYTNVCITDCGFCAFYRHPGDHDTYTLDVETILKKVEALVKAGGTQVLLQGGHNPELHIEYYENVFRAIKKTFPQIYLHSLTASELDHIAKMSKLEVKEVIRRLQDAGWGSLPGGGAEILVERVKNILSPKKISVDRWFEIHEICHTSGIRSTATMMFGTVETKAERIQHLQRVRDVQDRTKGFRAFIPWSFCGGETELEGLGEPGGVDYLKTLAISRIFLDNIPYIHTGWVTEGMKVAQAGLYFGADDFGSILYEEKVITSTGVDHQPSINEIVHAIQQTGKIAAQRDTEYHILKIFD